MAKIEYDGITFYDVKDLITYKKDKVGLPMQHDPKVEQAPSPQTNVVTDRLIKDIFPGTKPNKIIKIKRQALDKRWSMRDDRLLKEAARLIDSGLPRKEILAEFSVKLGRSIPSIEVRMSNKRLRKTISPRNKYMLRNAPIIPVPFDESRTKLAHKATSGDNVQQQIAPPVFEPVVETKPQPAFIVPEFPSIYPVSDDSQAILEQMLKDLIAGHSEKIDLFQAKVGLMLKNNLEWNGHVWRQFCEQVYFNAKKLNEYFLLKDKTFSIKKDRGGYHMIVIQSGQNPSAEI